MAADASTVGWILTAVGWIVSSQQANAREARKEKRAEIDACSKLAAELFDKSRKFYLKPGEDSSGKSEAAEIRFAMQRLLKRLERLQYQNSAFAIRVPAGEYMDSLTGEDFESVARPALLPDDPRLQQMEADSHAVIDSMELGYERAFASAWWQRWWIRLLEWPNVTRF